MTIIFTRTKARVYDNFIQERLLYTREKARVYDDYFMQE